MINKGNREFKELIKKVYKQKFDNLNDGRRLIDETKTIPSFFCNSYTHQIRIELKEDNMDSHLSDLEKFYDNLQNKIQTTEKEIIIEIDGDEQIQTKLLSKY